MSEVRHRSLGLTDDKVLEMYETMLMARKIDERMWLLNRAGKIPFVVSCQGQEAAQVAAAFALNREVDYVAPYYRDRSEEHTSELQSRCHLVCRLLLEK